MRRVIFFYRVSRGFTLIEALTAAMIVTVSGAAMLMAVGQALKESDAGIDGSRANMMVRELMAEIAACRWADADQPGHWGPEDGELGNTRTSFDDLDDYDGWQGPPQTKTGTQFDAWQSSTFETVPSHPYAKYTCSVHVATVSAAGATLPATLPSEQTSPYRRVTVEVTREGEATHRLSQTFVDLAPLLGRTHWLDPNRTEALAVVEVVP